MTRPRRPPPGRSRTPSVDGAPILEARKVTRRFGGLVAVDAVDLDGRAGRDRRPHRAQRGRQDHVLQLPHRACRPHDGRHPVRGKRINGLPPGPDHQGRRGPDVPEHPPVPPHDRPGERAGRPALPHPRGGGLLGDPRGPRFRREEREARGARPSCWRSSAWPARATSWPATCPTATSAGWRSPGPWPPSPGCSCSTSRRRA